MKEALLLHRASLAELDAIERLISEARNRIQSHYGHEHCLSVRDEYRTRRARDAAFGPLAAELFGEPAWDILLDLSMAATAGRRISVSSACIAAAVPPTTALRHLGVLEQHGLVSRQSDPRDRRRVYVQLTAHAEAAIERWQNARETPRR